MSNTMIENGLVHVYTGSGKGKSTTAFGVALRALGWGIKVCVVQFIKGYSDIGEVHFAHKFGDQLIIKQFAEDESRHIDEEKVARQREAAQEAMQYAQEVISSGKYGLVILDEINNALHYNLISIPSVLSLIKEKPANVELILTGRNAPAEIIEAADYVTEMKLIKHPYQKNIQARKGIDY